MQLVKHAWAPWIGVTSVCGVSMCSECGLENRFLTAQPCGHMYCHRCVAKAELNGHAVCSLDHASAVVVKKFDDFSYTNEEDICCYCNDLLDLDNIKSHYDECQMYLIGCKFCNGKLNRRAMKSHAAECARNFGGGKISLNSCEFRGTASEIEQHQIDNVHVEMVTNLLSNLHIEQSGNESLLACSFNQLLSLRDVVGCSQCKVNDIADQKSSAKIPDNVANVNNVDLELEQNKKIEELEHKYEKVNNLQIEFSKQIATILTANNELTKAVAEGRKFLDDKIGAYDLKQKEFEDYTLSDKLEKKSDQKDELTACGITINRTAFNYTWAVENFSTSRLLANKESICSDNFYCGSNYRGYKFRLKLQPDLFLRNGTYTYFSMFLESMAGPFDQHLKWPLLFTAQLCVLDQSTRKENLDICKIEGQIGSPIVSKNIETFKFPTPIFFGKLKVFDSQYLVNDTIFFYLDFDFEK
uniref:MATH domain-containing protein n=1 Tax=Strigamia maritima TaxID=126957 RepID=T1J335_STRMM